MLPTDPARCCEEPTLTAERAPEALQGLEWVVRVGGDYREYGDGGGDGYPTLRARSWALQAHSLDTLRMPPPGQ